ncbi:3-hydroxyacyl-CoA dehydrogenase NAD-binding domain-containing protein [Paenisporosarcina cavernae]|uniref:L-gulonate 3-dehydrogenase n=1 Tax=Paenisporosarcina cavernae TaxID=2320858 RepID=A0A385YY37_9BACL|nr:3-hydroxyacyl-CoA dehydrogenase NAD-binding domain-containing protein [Paenisporosarcina cavernae]AYC30453.1 hypothetical protein D3873_11650 [Paenisporosarcina cavernae]
MKRIAVVGAGTIGLSWATLFATKGFRVFIYDPRNDLKEVFEEYVQSIKPTLELLELPTEEWVQHITLSTSLEEAVKDAQIIQENGPENLAWKQQLYAEMEQFVAPDTLFLSSSSTLGASDIAEKMQMPGRMLIGHPFNPPLVMPLVEVVPGKSTSQDSVESAMTFYASLGKKPRLIQKEVFGFVANRLQFAMLQEAMHLVDSGVVSMNDLDEIVKDSIGLRWAVTGPMLGMHLGGGQSGMEAFLRHLGTTMERTWREQGDVVLDDETIKRLAEKSLGAYGHRTIAEHGRARDELQIEFLTKRREK